MLQNVFDEAMVRSSPPTFSLDGILGVKTIEEQKCVVIYGAGVYGGRTSEVIRKLNPSVDIYFTDENPKKWGCDHVGYEVVAPKELAVRFGEKVLIVIAVSRYFWDAVERDRVHKLIGSLGCDNVFPYSSNLYYNGSTYLQYDKYAKEKWEYFTDSFERSERAMHVLALLDDNLSKSSYCEYFSSFLSRPIYKAPEMSLKCAYFSSELYTYLKEERVVDCGAYNGDTLESFLTYYESVFNRYDALEPHPKTFSKLRDVVDNLPEIIRNKIAIYEMGTGCRRESIKFFIDETEPSSSLVSQDGTMIVEMCALDDLLYDKAPTLIKMDIEGSEMNALLGAQKTIRDHRPVLSISIYHRPEDLIDIPLWIKSQASDYRLFVRKYYSTICMLHELVLYAIPPERMR